MDRQYQFHEGDEVFAADGDKVGKLAGVTDSALIVEKGFFFPTDYHIPFSAVSTYDANDGKIYLSVGKDAALNNRWDETVDTGAYAGTTTGYSDVETTGYATQDRTTVDDSIVVPVHEEELTATKRMREAGEVTIDKHVEAREQTIEVPVTEERVHVTRRTVDRDATTGEDVFTEERIDVPLRAEEVELQKRTRVAEEIEIDKEQVQRTERVSGTVRKEVVDVDDVAADAGTVQDRGSDYRP
jgi:uncharacterized protein (TIGR02271 family)